MLRAAVPTGGCHSPSSAGRICGTLHPQPWTPPCLAVIRGHLLHSLGGGCLAHLEGDVVEVATAAKRGPTELRGPVGRRLGARVRSPGTHRSGPVGSRQSGGSRHAAPLALGGLLPGHDRRPFSALPQWPLRPGRSRSPHRLSPTQTRTRPAAAAAVAVAASSQAPVARPAPAVPQASQPLRPGLPLLPPMACWGGAMQMRPPLQGRGQETLTQP